MPHVGSEHVSLQKAMIHVSLVVLLSAALDVVRGRRNSTSSCRCRRRPRSPMDVLLSAPRDVDVRRRDLQERPATASSDGAAPFKPVSGF